MGLFWGQYFKALAATAIAMAVYCLTVVPLIEPTERREYEIPKGESPQAANQWWHSLFTKGDWQLEQPTIVHNSRGVLLAQNWEQIRPESWKLTPLTMILAKEPSEDPSEEQLKSQDVWIISAQEAVIHFEQPFDIRTGTMPSVQKGQLAGEILITQMNSGDPSAKRWQLRTRDVNIDRRRIWTQQEVQIDFDSSRIRGHDLRINLLSDVLSKRSRSAEENSASKFGPLEEIELMHLTELAIALEPGGIWANANPELLQLNQSPRNLPARVEATCGGRFTFNFSKELASLTGGVHLKHFLGGLPPDEFLCHKVNIRFQYEKDGKSTKLNSTSRLSIRDIDAVGIDSLEEFVGEKWVDLKSPLLNATARAKRMYFDLTKQFVTLAGKLDQPDATQSIAELSYRGYHFKAPMLKYTAAPKGPNGQALHAGWMEALGAGELSSPAESRLGEAQVRWQDRFVWTPTEVPGEQKIELTGQTLVELKQQGFLTADALQIWLARKLSPDNLSPGDLSTRVAGEMRSFQPKRVISTGKSVIATNQAQVNVHTLDVAFDYPNNSEGESPDLNSPNGSNPFSQFVSQPPRAGVKTGANNSKQPESPLVINGQSLVAKISTVGKNMWIDAMTIQGPLELNSPKEGRTAAWSVEGSALNLATTPSGDLDMEIEGQPASVHVADGSIQGPRIGFNQKQNRVWMDQPGEFTLPTELKTRSGQAMKWVKPLTCTWKRRMVFDGDRVRFEGDIELLGTLQQQDGFWFVRANCQELDLQLSQPIKFEQLNKLKQLNETSQLQQIVLRENVDLLVSRKDNLGNRISCGRLIVPTTLTIDVPEEKIVAAGPGRGYSNFLAKSGLSVPRSDSQGNSLKTLGFSYRDSLTIFMDRKECVVDGNVEVLTGPIQSWDEELSLNTARLTLDQFISNSDQVKLYDTSGLRSTQSLLAVQGLTNQAAQWEVQAAGNVRFAGSADSGEYSGNANQVVLYQAKDQLRLSGDGRSKAVIRVLPSPKPGKNDSVQTVSMDNALFNIKNRQIIDMQGMGLEYENVQESNQPKSQNPAQFPAVPGSALPAAKPLQNVRPEDPRTRSINRLLQGYGS
jgi:hypothetical protein